MKPFFFFFDTVAACYCLLLPVYAVYAVYDLPA
jgi:hypothetical protein